MPKSMTGFSCFQGQINDWHVLIEMKSVNARYLDIQYRFPDNLIGFEDRVAKPLREHIQRGRVELRCHMTPVLSHSHFSLDEARVAIVRDLAIRVNEAFPSAGPLTVQEVLSWPGVLIGGQAELNEAFYEALFAQCVLLIADHQRQCLREGAAITRILEDKLAAIDIMLAELRGQLPHLMAVYRAKIQERLRTLAAEFQEEKLQQEVLFYSMRSDIAEELDRLSIHVAACTQLLETSGPVGKRLDFLMQECHREANTIASKSSAPELSQYAIALKVCIEEMREQIQNLE